MTWDTISILGVTILSWAVGVGTIMARQTETLSKLERITFLIDKLFDRTEVHDREIARLQARCELNHWLVKPVKEQP